MKPAFIALAAVGAAVAAIVLWPRKSTGPASPAALPAPEAPLETALKKAVSATEKVVEGGIIPVLNLDVPMPPALNIAQGT